MTRQSTDKTSRKEVLETQLEVSRLMDAMKNEKESRKSIIDVPFITPMAFPLMVNRMRKGRRAKNCPTGLPN
ncbi:MAG: hypothetical protein IPN18_22075 [Ignavibacteriales bacterium]|nr:hypothetical protein [Ignavibacteriales bacterium]